jgi:hypothetical protein
VVLFQRRAASQNSIVSVVSPVRSRTTVTTGCATGPSDKPVGGAQGLLAAAIAAPGFEGRSGATEHVAATVALTANVYELVAAMAGAAIAHKMRIGVARPLGNAVHAILEADLGGNDRSRGATGHLLSG